MTFYGSDAPTASECRADDMRSRADKNLVEQWDIEFCKEAACLQRLDEHAHHTKWIIQLEKMRDKYVDERIEEEMECLADEADEHADPYSHRGLRRSDF